MPKKVELVSKIKMETCTCSESKLKMETWTCSESQTEVAMVSIR